MRTMKGKLGILAILLGAVISMGCSGNVAVDTDSNTKAENVLAAEAEVPVTEEISVETLADP